MLKQKPVFESGNELAAMAAKQINYHIMGYYPITPSTQVAEELDLMVSEGECTTKMIPAEGEHSAAGICFGASAAGARVLNATSANGLMYCLEQLPVQSGTRLPMVMNVACRTISGPLSIKGDHSDIMYALNAGWIILFAYNNQQVYDFNIIGLKIAEKVKLPVIVAYDGFFTSHQKKNAYIFENDCDVKNFVGRYEPEYTCLNFENPVTIGSYMNEPDLTNNKYQLHKAMEKAKEIIPVIFEEYKNLTERKYSSVSSYLAEDADVIFFALGSAYDTARISADKLRQDGKKVGVATLNMIRPFPKDELYDLIKSAKAVIAADRQDSYGFEGGNMSTELKAVLHEKASNIKVITRIFGLGGLDFFEEDAQALFEEGLSYIEGEEIKAFDYIGKYKGNPEYNPAPLYNSVKGDENCFPEIEIQEDKIIVKNANLKKSTGVTRRIAPGHGACPGCGIPVNLNHLLKGIRGNVVFLFQTGCAMVVTTSYPKTAFKVNYVHNLFQNGGAALSGIVEAYYEKVRRKEIPDEKPTFIAVSGDGGLDIGLGSALGAAFRNHRMIIFEYDNGGYMNTGYQLSYSTPLGAKSSTSHVGKAESGKGFMQKDNPQIFSAAGISYVATVSESDPVDFIKKAAKAQYYANNKGLAYIKAISACPLNWNDNTETERKVIEAAVDCCYHPLYEIENGITKINYDPESKNKKIDVVQWLGMMGRTKHLISEKYSEIVKALQDEIDLRWQKLKERDKNPLL